jgi:hypothetical protein
MTMQTDTICDHYERREFYDQRENERTGALEGEWKTEEKSLMVDIDLHRFQCSRCKQIGYYSGAAKAYYEEGKRAPGIQGLE